MPESRVSLAPVPAQRACGPAMPDHFVWRHPIGAFYEQPSATHDAVSLVRLGGIPAVAIDVTADSEADQLLLCSQGLAVDRESGKMVSTMIGVEVRYGSHWRIQSVHQFDARSSAVSRSSPPRAPAFDPGGALASESLNVVLIEQANAACGPVGTQLAGSFEEAHIVGRAIEPSRDV